MSIRPLYDAHGAEGYYREHGHEYQNPHFPEIRALLERNFERLDCTSVLDFAAGGGEAAQVLRGLGAAHITGCDPFTYELFEKNTGLPCLRHSFKDVIRGSLSGRRYSLIVSSFALHLCPPKDLYPLAWQLLQAAPLLVALTPHKRPELEALPGVALLWEDFVLTEREKKVRLKAYGMSNVQ
jgi:SAM-dependent methyltransferase